MSLRTLLGVGRAWEGVRRGGGAWAKRAFAVDWRGFVLLVGRHGVGRPWQNAKKLGRQEVNRPPTPRKKSRFRFGARRAESLYSPNTLIISHNFDPQSISISSLLIRNLSEL